MQIEEGESAGEASVRRAEMRVKSKLEKRYGRALEECRKRMDDIVAVVHRTMGKRLRQAEQQKKKEEGALAEQVQTLNTELGRVKQKASRIRHLEGFRDLYVNEKRKARELESEKVDLAQRVEKLEAQNKQIVRRLRKDKENVQQPAVSRRAEGKDTYRVSKSHLIM